MSGGDAVALPTIAGYAAVFFREGDPGTEAIGDDGKTILRYAPWSFTRAVQEDRVLALFDHRPGRVLGSTESGSLRLAVDSVGLRFELELTGDTPFTSWLIEAVGSGEITGASTGRTWLRGYRSVDRGRPIYEAGNVLLKEVSITPKPRFTGTSCWLSTAANSPARGDLDRIGSVLSRRL